MLDYYDNGSFKTFFSLSISCSLVEFLRWNESDSNNDGVSVRIYITIYITKSTNIQDCQAIERRKFTLKKNFFFQRKDLKKCVKFPPMLIFRIEKKIIIKWGRVFCYFTLNINSYLL
jgi:hypothetical protein